MAQRIIFITGTDTGVGKTTLTALLLHHLRSEGVKALAMKPFCSGDRDDANLLHELQNNEITLEETNPFYYSDPVAPLVAARKNRQIIKKQDILRKITAIKEQCNVLLIEGSGGLLVPLIKGYFVRDLIADLKCEVIIVAANKLGTINHTLLTVNALAEIGIQEGKIVLMETKTKDFSSQTNKNAIKEHLLKTLVFTVPFLGFKINKPAQIKKRSKKIKKTIAQIFV